MSDIVFGGWSDIWRTDLGYASVRSPDIRPPPRTISYYRKRGSASYIVREWLLWVVERERETPVTSFDITLKSRVISIMHMITSTSRRPPGPPTRRRVLQLSLSSARVHVHVKTRSLALERSSSMGRVRLMNDDREGEALRSLVSLPWITEQHFVGMLQARRIDQVDVYFPNNRGERTASSLLSKYRKKESN